MWKWPFSMRTMASSSSSGFTKFGPAEKPGTAIELPRNIRQGSSGAASPRIPVNSGLPEKPTTTLLVTAPPQCLKLRSWFSSKPLPTPVSGKSLKKNYSTCQSFWKTISCVRYSPSSSTITPTGCLAASTVIIATLPL